MSIPRIGLLLLAGCLSLPLAAGEFDQLVGALRKTWPERTSWAAVCDSAAAKGKLEALTAAAGPSARITVIDVKSPQDMGKALSALLAQQTQVLLLIPGDRIAGDGQTGATFLIQRMATQKIPTVATTEAGAKQGAVFAMGPGTGGKILVNAKIAQLVGAATPEGGVPIS